MLSNQGSGAFLGRGSARRLMGRTLGAVAAFCAGAAAHGQVVISQIWGGGGFVGDGPNTDCVELFNAGNSPLSLTGYSLQYRSATSLAAFSPSFKFDLAGTIPAKGYFLIRLENPAQTGFAITADQAFAAFDPLSVNRGQLALVIGTATLGAGCSPLLNGNTAIADFVGYGRGFANDNTDCTTPTSTFCAQCSNNGTGLSQATVNNAPGGTSTSGSAIWIRRKCGGLLNTGTNFDMWERVGPGTTIPASFRNSASPVNNAGISITPGPANAAAAPGGTVNLSAITSSDCGNVLSVVVNLTAIGGGAGVPLSISGLNTFTGTAIVGVGITPGPKTLVFTANAAGGLTSSANLTINITPANDECSGAIALGGTSPFSWSNVGATTGIGSQTFLNCDNNNTSNTGTSKQDVWYTWTAPSSGPFTFTTVGSVGSIPPDNRFDARLAIYDNTCPTNAPIACNDDAAGGLGPASALRLTAVAGTTYLIQIGADQPATTTSQGVLTISAGAPGVCCSGDEVCTVVADQADCTALSGTFQGPLSTCGTIILGCPSPLGACCHLDLITQEPTCLTTERQFCVQVLLGTFRINEVCLPDPCLTPASGRCCVGARCVLNVADAAACLALADANSSGVFTAGATDCNAGGSLITPCCFADYNKVGGLTVGDIFDFLNAWFANSVNADVNGSGLTVNDIFDFLNAWFAGGC
jgi:Lamin Tail Domain